MRQRALLLLVLLPACGQAAADGPSPATSPEAGLEVVPVVAKELDAKVSLPGDLTPYETVALYPRVSAFVEAVLVDRGSQVKKGDLLARLSAPELTAQRSEAESKAEADKSTWLRLKAASETPGAVASNDLQLAEASMKADQSKVEALRTLESYLSVRAPFEGVITERNVHPGALVGPPSGADAKPMLRLETEARLRLTVYVPEADVPAIPQGEKVPFVVRAWPGVLFSGTIARIAHSLELRTRTMPVELDVDNTDGRLASGMFADVHWRVHRTAPSLFVPASAVVQTTEATFIDRVRDGVVEQVPITRGLATPEGVEVFGQVSSGDLVLKRGSEDMKSGTRVTVARPR